MAAPVTLTITMQDGSTTVALTIPSNLTSSQFMQSLQLAGGTWDKSLVSVDTQAGATWWPASYWKKGVTS